MIDPVIEIAITVCLVLGVILLLGVAVGLIWMLEGPPRGWVEWRASRQAARVSAQDDETDPGPPDTWNALGS